MLPAKLPLPLTVTSGSRREPQPIAAKAELPGVSEFYTKRSLPVTDSPPATVTSRDLTVLVVDDDSDMLLLCAMHLKSAGFVGLLALGSAEAQATCDLNLCF
jgi:hypothetical protein